jgi:hypothetical protein
MHSTLWSSGCSVSAVVESMSIHVSSLGWFAWKEASMREPEETGEGVVAVGLVADMFGWRMKGSEFERLCFVVRCFVKSVDFFLRV